MPCTATVTAVDGDGVVLDRTAFYADGRRTAARHRHARGRRRSPNVRKEGDDVWHTLDGAVPASARWSQDVIDWERRHQLMRTHTAMHVLCGVIWNEWGKAVTGGNMEPLEARMDFEFDPLPEGFAARVEELGERGDRGRPSDRDRSSSPRDTALGGRGPDPHARSI